MRKIATFTTVNGYTHSHIYMICRVPLFFQNGFLNCQVFAKRAHATLKNGHLSH
jgi:hypothetical protein